MRPLCGYPYRSAHAAAKLVVESTEGWPAGGRAWLLQTLGANGLEGAGLRDGVGGDVRLGDEEAAEVGGADDLPPEVVGVAGGQRLAVRRDEG